MLKKVFKSQEIKIAFIAIVSLLLLIWGINFLKGRNIFKKQHTYYGVFDKASGLMSSNLVTINGVNIGIVNDIELFGSSLDQVIVSFDVNKNIQIPVNSQIRIISPGIIGSLQLECVLGDATTYYQEGDTLIGFIQPTLLSDIGIIKDNLDTFLTSLKEIMQQGDIQASMHNINSITTCLDSILYSGRIENILLDIETLTSTLEGNHDEIDQVIKDVNQFSGSLAQVDIAYTINELTQRLKQMESILSKIEKGEGTLGQLNNNDTLYKNLDKSINSLDLLINDIKANPKRYINVTIFGGKKKE